MLTTSQAHSFSVICGHANLHVQNKNGAAIDYFDWLSESYGEHCC